MYVCMYVCMYVSVLDDSPTCRLLPFEASTLKIWFKTFKQETTPHSSTFFSDQLWSVVLVPKDQLLKLKK